MNNLTFNKITDYKWVSECDNYLIVRFVSHCVIVYYPYYIGNSCSLGLNGRKNRSPNCPDVCKQIEDAQAMCEKYEVKRMGRVSVKFLKALNS